MKTDTKKRLRKECDILLQQKSFQKYGRKCEVCGGTYRLGGHHIFSKRLYSHLRYDLENIAVLCSACHIIRLHSQADPLILETIKKKRKRNWFKKLSLKAKNRPSGVFLTEKWYKSRLEDLTCYF